MKTQPRMVDRGELDALTHPDLRPPEHAGVAEARAHRRTRLAGACRVLSMLGYDHWVAGHVTVRDPEHEERFWVTPLGVSWSRMLPDDLLLVDHEANVLEGELPVNAAAFAIHAELHRARPDVVAAAHCHTRAGRAWAATGRPLEPISQDHCAFHGDHAVFDDYTGAVYDRGESARFAHALGSGKALILQSHGLLTVGQTVDEAVFWMHLLEVCCETMLRVSALAPRDGQRAYHVLSESVAAQTREQVGEPLHGWRGFQPLWDQMRELFPDFPG